MSNDANFIVKSDQSKALIDDIKIVFVDATSFVCAVIFKHVRNYIRNLDIYCYFKYLYCEFI